VICQKSADFHVNTPVSLKLYPWICTSQWQHEAGAKGGWKRNRQPCPERCSMRFTFPAWITEIMELDLCLPSSSAIEPTICLESGFFPALFCFAFKKKCLFVLGFSPVRQLGS